MLSTPCTNSGLSGATHFSLLPSNLLEYHQANDIIKYLQTALLPKQWLKLIDFRLSPLPARLSEAASTAAIEVIAHSHYHQDPGFGNGVGVGGCRRFDMRLLSQQSKCQDQLRIRCALFNSSELLQQQQER